MFIKDTFKDWTETCIQSKSINHLEYIRTFSIKEFKQFFSLDKIWVKKHPGGFLYFETLRSDWGLVYGNDIVSNPVISVVIEYWGNMFFLLHKKGDMPQFIHINSTAQQRQLNLSTKGSSYSYMSRKEYDDYLNDSYMDAFESAPDAYWNID